MSNYTKVTNFTAKDSLPSGNTGKVVRGSEIDTEFTNIQTAVNSKADTASPTFTGTVTIPTAAIAGGSITGITDLAIADGGTGASTAQNARNNLLPSQSTHAGKYLKTDGTDVSWDALDISTADITGTLPIANGGTGATSASAARTALGVAIGTDVQAYDAQLADIAGLTPTDGNFIVGDGTNFVAESGATARTSLGLGSIATQAANNVSITGGSISGITDLAVADGGTGASDASGARTNLGLGSIATQDASNVSITGGSISGITDLAIADGGTGASTANTALNNLLPSQSTNAGKYLVTDGTNTSWDQINISTSDITGTLPIANGGTGSTTASGARTALGLAIGTDVQAYDAELAAIAGLTSAADKVPYFTGAGTAAVADFTSFGRSLVDDADASAARSTLGLVIGTNVQAYDAELAAIAGLTSAADKLPYFTGAGTASTTDFTSFGRSLVDDADASAARTTLGLVIGTNVQAYDAQLADVAGLTPTDNGVIIGNGTNFVVESGATLKTSLGLTIGTDVQAYDSNLTSFVNAFTLPTTDGTNGQALTTNGSGTISWSTVAGAPGGSNTQLQYNNSGAFAGASGLVTDGTNLTLNGQADLRFADSDSSNWVAFQAPATISSNVTWTLPSADGTSGQVLSTDGSGTLSWATASGGGGGGGTSVVVTQITATGGQTSFTVSYTVGQVSVYLNGALLAAADYTATSGTAIVLATGAAANDIFTAVAYNSATKIEAGDSKVEVTDTGSNGTIAFTTDNSERMRIDSSGNVGIGTTSPGAKLDVSGAVRGQQVIATTANPGHAASRALLSYGSNTASLWSYGADSSTLGSISFETRSSNGSLGQTIATFNQYGLGLGTAVPSSGIGICFPATQSASSNANTLDDYEEGTWTPTYVPETNSFTSITYQGFTDGFYTKIGNIVWIKGQIATTGITVGSATGEIFIGGLPFAGQSNPNWILCMSPSGLWAGEIPTAFSAGGVNGSLYYKTAADGQATTSKVADLSTGANNNYLQFTGVYRIA